MAGGLPLGKYRVFFLNGRAGLYVFTDVRHSSVIAARRAAAPTDRAIDAIARLVGGAVTADKSSRDDKLEAIDALSVTASPVSMAMLKPALTDADGDVALEAAGALLQLNDASRASPG